jgi:putative DNA primase/helicase
MLAIALAFVGPVADLMKVETPMIQLFGAPGAGKSAIAAAAGSVWGGDGDELFLQTWNHTANNLELVAAAHHAAFLVLDETRLSDQPQARPSGAFFAAVMRLAEGRTRGGSTTADPRSALARPS